MPRTTKSVTAKSKHKKVLSLTRDTMAQEADYIKPPNSLILNLYNTLLETEKIKKEHLGHYG